MNVKSAKFVKGIVGPDDLLESDIPQVAFIGRSNVGKSSTINALVNQKDLARTSSFPGRTQQVNLFLINKSYYLVDLPGYGYAKASHKDQERIQELIGWYLFDSHYKQKKVVLIIDAHVGMTENDREMFQALESKNKKLIVVANKIDKVKKAQWQRRLLEIQAIVGQHKIIPYSAEKKIGLNELNREILS